MLRRPALYEIADSPQAAGTDVLKETNNMHVPMPVALVSYWAGGMRIACVPALPLGLSGPAL